MSTLQRCSTARSALLVASALATLCIAAPTTSLPLTIYNTVSGTPHSGSIASLSVAETSTSSSASQPTSAKPSALATTLIIVSTVAGFMAVAARQEKRIDAPLPSPNAMYDIEDPYRRQGPLSPIAPPSPAYLSPGNWSDSDTTLTSQQASAFLRSTALEKEKELPFEPDHQTSPYLPSKRHTNLTVFVNRPDSLSVVIEQPASPVITVRLPAAGLHEGLTDDQLSIYAVSIDGSTLEASDTYLFVSTGVTRYVIF
ncbi:hypothetical protein BKA62DRAFT_770708 [Auriculariales sp. MPI-PUGE-AT-0066]|nr:hypothetical protein BKA62DRAFT_770708 [Auriculariales sp. MPI-PUGE-AT-0066]